MVIRTLKVSIAAQVYVFKPYASATFESRSATRILHIPDLDLSGTRAGIKQWTKVDGLARRLVQRLMQASSKVEAKGWIPTKSI